MMKITNENLKKLYDKNILLLHIVVQLLLFILYVIIYVSKAIGIIEGLIILASFGICYLSFLLIAYLNKNFQINKVSFLTLVMCIYFIAHEKIYEICELEIYISAFLIFYYLETIMGVLTLDLVRIRFYRSVVIILTLVNMILHITQNQYNFFLYGIIWILIGVYPLVFLVINFKKTIRYGSKILPTIILLILLQIVFILSTFFISIPVRSTNNYDIIFYIIVLEVIFYASILRIYNPTFELKKFLRTKNLLTILFVFSVIFFLKISQIQFDHVLIAILFLLIFQHEVGIYEDIVILIQVKCLKIIRLKS